MTTVTTRNGVGFAGIPNVGQTIFGYRTDLDLSQRWWHRLAKVAFILVLCGWTLWLAFTIPADLPDGSGNIRIVETLGDYVKARPDAGDPVASFAQEYGYRSGKQEPNGSVSSSSSFETSLYCAVKPYENLYALSRYLRPATGAGRPTQDDALKVLQDLNVVTC